MVGSMTWPWNLWTALVRAETPAMPVPGRALEAWHLAQRIGLPALTVASKPAGL